MRCRECGGRTRVVHVTHRLDGTHRWLRCLVCKAPTRTIETYAIPKPGPPRTPGIKHFGRAADLLERLSPPQPVPVSERLPRPEDCDGEGKYWWFHDEDNASCSHWLPANALPLPQGEVEP